MCLSCIVGGIAEGSMMWLNKVELERHWIATIFLPSSTLSSGAIGLVMGHELTHGFDDEGVQWDSVGKLMGNGSWMDAQSLVGFKNMSTCVQNEYHQFCYKDLPKPNCINGVHTQGENIADNGGVKSSFFAYKEKQGLEGTPPRLPGAMSKYTHDQLYFLSFGQVWCRSINESAITNQLLNDPHSPARYRVLGTVRNFDKFGEAFNCPKGSPLRPNSHCDVW